MPLSTAQKRSLYDHGYVRLPGVVPRRHVDRALRAINNSLGFQGLPPDELVRFRAQSYCPELQRSPVISDLLNETPLWQLAESAIGEGRVQPVNSGQIALRFPSMDPPKPPGAHIDGMYTPTNGVPKGEIRNFTALIGVLLSDLPSADAGNFTVFPGTHRTLQDYFRAHGPQALLEGMPPVEMPAPLQMTGQAGDAFLCHYQLAHGIASNASPHIRYAIFFRLKHVDHESVHWECMTDIWREWEHMDEIVETTTGSG